ncbi:hypothetical protein WA026_022170 [Henosepilachna vigintioctopunctata]|uniref:Uncharacterized protein n=1 Tax=Henosepilachna vigintioctopunctata TaxID=420089 RepID=A0AAW1TZ19_9CUCU
MQARSLSMQEAPQLNQGQRTEAWGQHWAPSFGNSILVHAKVMAGVYEVGVNRPIDSVSDKTRKLSETEPYDFSFYDEDGDKINASNSDIILSDSDSDVNTQTESIGDQKIYELPMNKLNNPKF